MIVCAQCGFESLDEARFCAVVRTAFAPTVRREERKVVSIVFVDLVGLDGAGRAPRPGGRAGVARGRTTAASGQSSSATAARWRSSSATPWWRCSARRSPTRTTPSAPCARPSPSATRSRSFAPTVSLRVRVGVNTGEALVTLDARPAEGEGMVAGDVVNTAARLQSAAPVDGILVGEGTYRATRTRSSTGRPSRSWQRARASRSRPGKQSRHAPGSARSEQAPPAALVGRGQEARLLRDTLERARRERAPQLLTLVGVPGIGKSRLVDELLESSTPIPI